MKSVNNGQLNKKMRGFTLVELIVVLVIVAILAAVAVPTFLAFIDRAKEKDYETNAQKCLASTQAALSEIFSDAGNSFSIKKRESVRDLCDSDKKSTEFIVWTKDALDSKTVRALPDYIASYTIEKALYEEAGYYFAYDGKKWEIFRSDKAREEAIAFLSVDNSKAIYMWPYKQDLAYYPEFGEGGEYTADDSDTVKVVNLNLDTTCLNYVYFAPKGSDGNTGLKTIKVIFWKDASGTTQSTWSMSGTTHYFSYDDSNIFELHEERYPVEGWVPESGGNCYKTPGEVATYIYSDTSKAKTYNFNIKLGEGGEFTVENVYISKSAFSKVLSSASGVTGTEKISLSTIKNEKQVPTDAVRIDDTSVKDGFVYAWYEGNTFKWWTNAEHAFMPADCSGLFKGKTGIIKFSLAGMECDNVTNMSEMFASNTSLQEITGIGITGNVTNTSNMFNGCSSLTNAEISSLTGSISAIKGMFEGCSSITSIDFSDAFDTSAVIDYSNLFKGCANASSIDTTGFDLSSAKNIDSMFEGCKSVTSIDAKSWNLKNLENMNSTFKGCTSLTILPTSSIITTRQLKGLKETFAGCYRLSTIDISGINAGNVTTAEKMFSMREWASDADFISNSNLTTIKFGTEFDSGNATSMAGMFEYCTALTSIQGLEYVHTRKVTDMSYMFAYTYNLTELKLASFDTKSVTNCDKMFYYDKDNKLSKVYVSKNFTITGDKEMFAENTAYIKLVGGRNTTVSTINDSDKYDTSRYAIADGLDGKPGYFTADFTKVYIDKTKFQSLFTSETDGIIQDCSEYSFSEIQYKEGIIDIRDSKKMSTHYVYAWREGNIVKWWSDAEEVHLPDDCEKLFQNNTNIKSFSFKGFDVSNVTAFNYCFDGCSNLTSVEFGNMFYTDNLKKIKIMFRGCSKLTSIDLSGWNTSKISEYGDMFNNCSELTTIYSDGSFSVPGTTANMFSNCTKLKGGSNSAYASLPNPQRSQYARIDGGTSSPGYFTRK